MKFVATLAVLLFFSPVAVAQDLKLLADDSRAIQSCIKEKESRNEGAERCINLIADRCLETPEGQSTHGQADCFRREHLVWDDILNETYRRLQGQFEGKLKNQLRDVQRSWLEARKQQCEFYVDVIKGSMAIPMSASCMNSETARRALYLLNLLNI